MHVISRWAIFWILITYAVADSVRNGNENTIGFKASRIAFSTTTGEEKRTRQRRDNVTEPTVRKSAGENASPPSNLIEDAARHTQHPVKKQIKFKRLRYLSGDHNATKVPADKLKTDDTKEFKRRATDVTAIAAASIAHPNPARTDPADGDSGDGENAISGRSEGQRTPSHRKKRRRIATSITALSGGIRPESKAPPRDRLIPYLDFGKKIPAATSRRYVVASTTTDGSRQSGAVDANSDGPATTSTSKPVTLSNLLICGVTTYRTLRPGAKNLKREVGLNGTSCRWNVTADQTEQASRLNFRVNDAHGFEAKALKVSTESETESTPALRPVTPVVAQFTTKILSTAVITSVSVKSHDKKAKVPTTTASSAPPVESRKKYGKEMAVDAQHHRKPEVVDAKLYEANISAAEPPPPSTMRPSLVPYTRHNASKTRNVNRSVQFPKLTYPAVGRLLYNVTLATTEPVRTSTENASEPSVEYLMNATTMATPASRRPELETSSPEPGTTLRSTIRTTVTGGEPETDNASSTPLFVTYEGVERDTENWRYRVRNETAENSTVNPKVFTIFSRNGHQNYSLGEQVAKPSPGLQNAEQFDGDSQTGFHIATYVLAGLGVIPLVIGIVLVMKMILHQNKKQIFEGSEYSSEYNRNPLEFNAGVTSSPIATKLPRVPQQTHWEIERKSVPSISVPNNSRWEFPRNKLRLQTILGQGNFGQVWKAEADDISGHEGLTRLVAVKMVKEISSTREKEDLIKELMIMQHLGSHPNVVTLLGCCTEKEPYMLIMEYVMYGKLLSFLRDHRTRTHYFNFSDNGDTLTSRDLTVFAYCVARGMEYLQNKQVIHRDLAARNILIDHNKLCKIADFGMSRYVDESGQVYEHRQSKGALPIRWMAPESLHYSCYTHKTDVWSFGILMWEIVTLGSMPYASMGARVVMRKVKEGYRLEKPKHCKSSLFNVISKCWHSDPNKRPSFTELKQDLLDLLEDSEQQGNFVDLDSLVEEMNQTVHGSHNEKFII